MKYKYVKFSRKTARKNPDMILREYNRIIEEMKSNIKYAFEKIYEFKVSKNNVKEIPIVENEPLPGKVTFIANYDDLKMIVDKIETNIAKNIKKRELLFKIKEERDYFRRVYIIMNDNYQGSSEIF